MAARYGDDDGGDDDGRRGTARDHDGLCRGLFVFLFTRTCNALTSTRRVDFRQSLLLTTLF